ncbi:hypothetical protein ES705_41874 [subsurface metagenome]
MRDGWSIDENSVRVDARQAGNQSPAIFVFVPKRSADDLRHKLIAYKAASATLDKRGAPDTPEGTEARAAMETTMQSAEIKINELLEEAFSGARVFQGGGNEILGNNLQEMIMEAAENSLKRLYPQFHKADHAGWEKVYSRARQGSPDTLKAVGHDGEPVKNSVCKTILGLIAGGKKGSAIRTHFEDSPFGWPRDAVDGGLQVLLVAGLIRAQDERGRVIEPRQLERKQISKIDFKVESVTVTTSQRIQVRKLLQKVGCQAKQGEELALIADFLQKMQELAGSAGAENPKPERPDTTSLDEIRLTAGNEQILALYNRREEIKQSIDHWTDLASRIEGRWPSWLKLTELLQYADILPDAAVYLAQVKHIKEQRLLLEEPDMAAPIVSSLTQLLRNELNMLDEEYNAKHKQGMSLLENDENWQQLEPEQRYALLDEQLLRNDQRPKINVQTTDDILATLSVTSLHNLRDRVVALTGRFEQVLQGAAKAMEPKVKFIQVPHSR